MDPGRRRVERSGSVLMPLTAAEESTTLLETLECMVEDLGAR